MTLLDCPDCGLTFINNKRKFSSVGEPTVSLNAHAADHKREAARKEEQEGRGARQLTGAYQLRITGRHHW